MASSRSRLRRLAWLLPFAVLAGVTGAVAAACSAPPFGWQGAGRIQGLPEQTTFPADAGADTGGVDANDGSLIDGDVP